jgi:hypothetical protein
MQPYPTRQTSGMAIAGFVVSLVACGILGLILSIVAHYQVARSNGQLGGGGFALAGILLGLVHVVIEVVIVAIAAGRGNA